MAVSRCAVSAAPKDHEVTSAALSAGCADFERAKGEFYARRLEELATRQLLPVGRAVAEGFRGRPVLSRADLEDAIGAGLDDPAERSVQVNRTLETLRDLGFVWRVEARTEWEPGIPSLLAYAREHADGR